jgi:NAD(P)-dependent dehydrogenase (short-subunit alcohol dehydrogenase family)
MADAHGSGPCVRKDVGVQLPPRPRIGEDPYPREARIGVLTLCLPRGRAPRTRVPAVACGGRVRLASLAYSAGVDGVLPRVVVTGAAGRIGRSVSAVLASRWELVATDLRAADGVAACDVTSLEACRAAFAGADAVVHLAADPDPSAGWERLERPNVVGAYTVARAAMDCGVRRLVLASSLQAVSGVAAEVQVRGDDQARPANLYGATKAWAEALGSWVAASSDTTVVALRIGYFAEERPDGDAVTPLERAAWLSARDAAELVRAAVEADGVDFLVADGVSANRHARADVGRTVRALGYRPVDDAWAEG